MRLPPPLIPPLRFCLVEEGVYRGAYPSLVNLRFLTRLGLRSIVSFLPEPPAPHLVQWCDEHGVRLHFERVEPFREEVTLTPERAAELLQLLVLVERQPVYVHCLDGVGVTGLLIMCLRKLMRWAPSPVLAEYARFNRTGLDVASPPPQHVIAFLNGWKPELEFVPQHLPTHPPLWLEAALQLESADLEPGAPRENSATDWTRETLSDRLLGPDDREHVGLARGELGRVAALQAMVESAGIGTSLDALAIEGLTMGPVRRAIIDRAAVSHR